MLPDAFGNNNKLKQKFKNIYIIKIFKAYSAHCYNTLTITAKQTKTTVTPNVVFQAALPLAIPALENHRSGHKGT